MAKQSLLLVDNDARSLRVLEVSLKKAGFNVTTAVNGRDGLDKVQTAVPDLIISDTEMPEMDGFAFCEQLKHNAAWADIPFIFLTKESSIEHKIRGLELGVEDYLTKPIYIKEILTRIRILLQKHQRARMEGKRDAQKTQFSGRITDMGVVDLIQTIEINRKSGLIHVSAGSDRRAVVYFRDGKVIDAEVDALQGTDAVYRLLTWNDGEFEVIFRNVRRKEVITISSQALLMEGMRRLDEWGRLLEQLPPLDTVFVVDIPELAERLSELPDELNAILKLFDGRRNVMDVVDASDYGDLACLEVIAKLYFEGLILEREDEDEPTATSRPRIAEQREASGLFAAAVNNPNAAPAINPSATPDANPGARSARIAAVPPGLPTSARAPSKPQPFTLRAPLDDQDDVGHMFEQSISDAELDLAGVGVEAQPQTSLVEAAIGAAIPLMPASEISDGAEAADTAVDTTPERIPTESRSRRSRRRRRRADRLDDVRSSNTPTLDDLPSGGVPAKVRPGDSAPVGIVSSEGAEVATASGEFSITEIEARGAATAREIVTIKPKTLDDLDPFDEPTPIPLPDPFADLLEESEDEFKEWDSQVSPLDEPVQTPGAASTAADALTADGPDADESSADLSADSGMDSAPTDSSAAKSDSEQSEAASAKPDVAAHPSGPDLGETARLPKMPSPENATGQDNRDSDATDAEPSADDDGAIDIHIVTEPPVSDQRASAPDDEHEQTNTKPREPAVPPLPKPGQATGGTSLLRMLLGAAVLAAIIIAFLMTRGDGARSNDGTGDDVSPDAGAVRSDASVGDAGVTAPVDAPAASPDAAPVVTDARPVDARPQVAATQDAAAPTKTAAEYYDEARRALRRDNKEAALEAIDNALGLRRSSRYYVVKTEILMELERFEDAAKAATRATRARSSNASAWFLKGEIHLTLGDNAEAKKAYQKFLELKPEGPEADEVRSLLSDM